MYPHILVPTDGSKLAHEAAVHALLLAKAVGATITALTVEPDFMSDRMAEIAKQASAQAASALKEIGNEAKAAGVPCETVIVTNRSAHEAILATAIEKGCDIIVMASHGQ